MINAERLTINLGHFRAARIKKLIVSRHSLIIKSLLLALSANAQNLEMSEQIIEKEIIIKASLEEVWNRWTTNEGIKSFFAQDCEVELQLGGKYEMYFLEDAPTGQRGSEGCKVLSFIPYEMFSFSWNAPPQFPSIRNSGTHTYIVLNFEKIKPRKTKIRLRHLGWQEGKTWDEVFAYFDEAWAKVLTWLAESFE